MKNPRVFVVIPNLNGKEELKRCLPSLFKQSQACQIVVVDNGSVDGSVGWLAQKYPQVQTVTLAKNFGFTAVNRGIELATKQGADFVALFNNDAIADSNWLRHLLARAQKNPRAGIVTGKLLQSDHKTIDSVGEAYSIWGLAFPTGRNQRDTGQYNQAQRVWGASGGASLYRVKCLEEIGLFDEAYFAYYEDGDLSFRANLSGWQVWYEPKAVAYHKMGATSSKMGSFRDYHRLKNFFFVYEKNMPIKLYWKYSFRYLVSGIATTIRILQKGHFGAAAKAYGMILINMPLVIYKRHKIKRSHSVSTEDIDKLLFHSAPPHMRVLSKLSRHLDRKYQ